jgi:hypothetical protein
MIFPLWSPGGGPWASLPPSIKYWDMSYEILIFFIQWGRGKGDANKIRKQLLNEKILLFFVMMIITSLLPINITKSKKVLFSMEVHFIPTIYSV